jgi:hypothetical protein
MAARECYAHATACGRYTIRTLRRSRRGVINSEGTSFGACVLTDSDGDQIFSTLTLVTWTNRSQK